jgi:F0F1-type ATP synthase assembly protein I
MGRKLMNKSRKDYIYNPKQYRAPKPGRDREPKQGNAGFVTGVAVGIVLGLIIAKWLSSSP